jgi:hypothetical protein
MCGSMVSWLPHYVIPVLVALAFFPVSRRTALLVGILAWVPDMDYIIQSQHRAITHSILIPLALASATVVLWKRRDPTARLLEFATRPGAPVILTLGAYYYASHLLLDVFQGGVVLLWPLLNTNFYAGFEILLNTGTNTFTPAAEAGTSEGAPELTPLYPWFSTEHAAIAVFLAACAAAGAALVWHKRRTRRLAPVIVELTATPLDTIQKP